jgi:hypothetical protein
MKEMAVEDISTDADGLAAKLRGGGLVLTHHGAPLAMVLSFDIYDAEDIGYMTSPEFWKMIEERRKEPTISWEEAKKELFGDEPPKEIEQR